MLLQGALGPRTGLGLRNRGPETPQLLPWRAGLATRSTCLWHSAFVRHHTCPHNGGGASHNSTHCGPHARQRAVTTAAAVAAQSALSDSPPPVAFNYAEIISKPSKQAPLPKPPKASTFADVLPYLLKLALAEKALYPRLCGAFLCLVLSKTAGMLCPVMMKSAVDCFTGQAAAGGAAVLQAATKFVLLYGLCDILKHVSKELQAPLFTPVSQAASRRVAYHTFSHVLQLDVSFHLERRTGRLSRILERGTRSIQMLYRAVIFTFVPTALELAVVACVLGRTFAPVVGALVLATFVAYVAWSIVMTQMAANARKRVNELDNATSAKAVDALLSYETVTLFNNQALESGLYNVFLKSYMGASITTERLAALLNSGQSVILAAGLTAIMVTAMHTPSTAAKAAAGAAAVASAGDLVMIQGLLLQLWAPLQFLGWFYRELRSALVDMEEFFAILRQESHIKDGTQQLPLTPPVKLHGSSSSSSSSQSPAVNTVQQTTNGSDHAYASNGSSSSNGNSSSWHSTMQHAHTSMRHGVDADNATTSMGNKVSLSSSRNGSHADTAADNGVNTLSAAALPAVSTVEQQAALEGDASTASQELQRGVLIELDNVHFAYNADRQILRGVSLRVESGRSLALVGPSGSGKSTVLKLLTRLYDTTGGAVRINGMDVRDMCLESLRAAVAVVPQETALFNDSIMQNIRYGRPEASDEEVVAAAQLAHLDKAVSMMPQGYGTVVGERGLKLSGGEKQRVAIARAFLREPRLLICDEATSALDSATEAQIMASLGELAAGRTSVFVAHRLSTIRHCDTIAVLKDGRVVEVGSHEELLARGPQGVYRSMWELQAAEEKLALQHEQVEGTPRRAAPPAPSSSLASYPTAAATEYARASQEEEDGDESDGSDEEGGEDDRSGGGRGNRAKRAKGSSSVHVSSQEVQQMVVG